MHLKTPGEQSYTDGQDRSEASRVFEKRLGQRGGPERGTVHYRGRS